MKTPTRPLIAGNWKMNGSRAFAKDMAEALVNRLSEREEVGFEMLLCPPAPLIDVVRESLGASGIVIGGQDCHSAKQGAHTDQDRKRCRQRDKNGIEVWGAD